MSANQIGAELNEAGVLTVKASADRAKGKPGNQKWSAAAVVQLLRSPRIAGYRTWSTQRRLRNPRTR